MIDFRVAVLADLPLILEWRQEGEDWLRARGSDQWSALGRPEFQRRVTESIARGETWIAQLDTRPVGTIAIDHITNPGLWSPAELTNSVVLHRMIVPRAESGQQIGEQLIDHAERVATDEGADWIVLDAWSTNRQLHAYYLALGFEHVRTVTDRNSGALFRRRVRASAGVHRQSR